MGGAQSRVQGGLGALVLGQRRGGLALAPVHGREEAKRRRRLRAPLAQVRREEKHRPCGVPLRRVEVAPLQRSL